MAGSDAKDRISYPLEKRVVNPIVLLAWDLGLPPPGDAPAGDDRAAYRAASAHTGVRWPGRGYLLASGPARARR
jgi:hypothetical protein